MKVLFFSHYFPPEGNAPASRVYETCRRWVEAGHEVTVITCAPNMPEGVVYPGYRNAWTRREEIDGIRVVRVWTYLAANRGKRRRALNFLTYMLSAVWHALFIRKPDIILATSPQFFCGWAGTICSWIKRVPFVLEVRDMWPDSIVEVGAMKSSFTVRVLQWLETRMYNSADRIVTVGYGYRKRLMARDVPEEKISVIPNGADFDLFNGQPSSKDVLPETLRDKFICSYVGTIGMACGLDVVLRAAEQLRRRDRNDIAFLLVGDGARRKQLEAEAARAGLENVYFMGRKDKAEIPALLMASDCCLVHLMKKNLFTTVLPSKMFEAMAMKRPVVLGVQGDAALVLKKAQAGVCLEPDNETQLVDALAFMKSNPDFCASLGESGATFVRRYYDRDRLSEAYLHVLERVLEQADIEEAPQRQEAPFETRRPISVGANQLAHAAADSGFGDGDPISERGDLAPSREPAISR